MLKGSASILLLSFWLLLTGINCQRKRNEVRSAKELDALVSLFQNESLKRGLDIDTSPESLLIGFGKVDSRAGSCKPNSYPKIITIDSLMWRALSAEQREILVYHELAHCLLNRKHSNDVLYFGECKSWMREDDSGCSINTINQTWREYYIDELFAGEEQPAPDWYDIKLKVDLSSSINSVSGKMLLTRSNTLQFDSVSFNTLQFDSSFLNESDNWMIRINCMEPLELNESFGININEYTIAFACFAKYIPTPDTVLSKMIMLNQYRFQKEKNILLWDTLKSIHKRPKLVIKKEGKAVFIFFDENLKLCIPIAQHKITISGYSAFKDDGACRIEVIEL